MAEQEINLERVASGNSYSDASWDKALNALANDLVIHPKASHAGITSVRCKSLTSASVWVPVAQFNDALQIIGITCNCPNGVKGGIRARCWHAAALEISNERHQQAKMELYRRQK